MSNGNFEHRLDALGRSLASAHDGPMPPALHEALGAKAATLHARKVGLAAILLMVLILVVIVLPKRVAKDDGAILDDLESIRRAVAPVWRARVNDESSATVQNESGGPRAGDRSGDAASPDVKK